MISIKDTTTPKFSLYDALNSQFGERFSPQLQRKTTLIVLSHALEDAVLDNELQPIIFTAFQQARYYAHEANRYEALGKTARIITVYGCEVPEAPEALEHDWFIIVNEPRFKAMMISRTVNEGIYESEAGRPFLCVWSYDHEVVDYACRLLAGRLQSDNNALQKSLDEVLNTPHQPLEQVRFAQDVGNRILHNLEHTNQQTIRQISRNQKLLDELQDQEKLLQEISQAAENVRSERTILQGELKKLYLDLTHSQQVMTEALIEKAHSEQRSHIFIAMLQNLENEISRIEASSDKSALEAATLRAKALIEELKGLTGVSNQ